MSPKPEFTPLEAPVPSPCIDVCRIDAQSGWCEGCHRTLDEIAQWAALTDTAKREVWQRLLQRRGAGAAAAQEKALKDKR
jgi:uncharacterized protein